MKNKEFSFLLFCSYVENVWDALLFKFFYTENQLCLELSLIFLLPKGTLPQTNQQYYVDGALFYFKISRIRFKTIENFNWLRV